MIQTIFRGLGRSFSKIGATIAITGMVLGLALVAETQPAPSFDVATIKPSHSEDKDSTHEDDRGGRSKIHYEGAPLSECIQLAYDVKDYQVLGPKWIKSQRYDIDAVGPNPSNDRAFRLLMLQNLLAERFQLKLHRETRRLPIYALVALKKGPKIGRPQSANGWNATGRNGDWTFKGISMGDLAHTLNQITGLPVIDKTGVAGRYDFDLHYSTESQAGIREQSDKAGAIDTSAPSVYTAIQEQLGLKLKPERGPLEVLVIDHIEPPSPN